MNLVTEEKKRQIGIPIFFSVLGWQPKIVLEKIRNKALWPFKAYWQEAIAVVLLVSLILPSFFNFFPGKPQFIEAATYTWEQTGWSGGDSETPRAHSEELGDPGNWAYYSTSTSGLSIGDDITLATSSSGTVTQTLYADFTAGTYENATTTLGSDSIRIATSTFSYDFNTPSLCTAGTNCWAYYGKDHDTDVPVAVDRSTWEVAGQQFSATDYENASTSNDARVSLAANADDTQQVIHDFIFTTGKVLSVSTTWEGYGSQGGETAANNDLRVYLYKASTGQFYAATSALDGICSASDCRLTTSTVSTGVNPNDFIDSNGRLRIIVQKYEYYNCTGVYDCAQVSGGECVAKSAGEQGLSACNRCDGSSLSHVHIAQGLQDAEGSNTCTATHYRCDGSGSCTAPCSTSIGAWRGICYNNGSCSSACTVGGCTALGYCGTACLNAYSYGYCNVMYQFNCACYNYLYCPSFYSWDGSDYVFDNYIIHELNDKSKEAFQERELTNISTEGNIKAEIREEMPETSYIDQLYLKIVDQNMNDPASVPDYGVAKQNLSTREIILRPIYSSQDLDLIQSPDEQYLVLKQGDKVSFEFEQAPTLQEGYTRKVSVVAKGYYIPAWYVDYNGNLRVHYQEEDGLPSPMPTNEATEDSPSFVETTKDSHNSLYTDYVKVTVERYYATSTFTSSIIDTGQESDFTTLFFSGTTSSDLTVKFQIRSATTSEEISSATWYGPTSTDYYYTHVNQAINSVHDGHRYIQYKAFLETSDTSQTPYLDEVRINYKYYSLLVEQTQTYSSAGTFTWTAATNTFSVTAEVRGGGGGGAGSGTTNAGGAGGGGGAYARATAISVIPASNYSVVVGAGGSAGASGNNNGGDGGDSYFKNISTVDAGGGKGGKAPTTYTGGIAGLVIAGTGYSGGTGGTGGSVTSACGGGGAGDANPGGNGGANLGACTGGAGGVAGGGAGADKAGTFGSSAPKCRYYRGIIALF